MTRNGRQARDARPDGRGDRVPRLEGRVSARRSTSSRTRISAGSRSPSRSWSSTVPVLARAGAGCSPRTAIHERVPWLTRAYFVAYTVGQVLPTSLGGRRGARRRDDTAPPRESDRRHRDGAARARCSAARRPRARRHRLPALDRPVRRERLPLARGRLRLRDDRPRVSLLRALGPSARCAGRNRSCVRLRLETPASALLRGHPSLPRASASARQGARRHARGAGGADPRRSGRPRKRSASTSTRASTTSSARCCSSSCSCRSR